VTVLFADMRGSLELLADRDPEEARQLLDAVLERMMEAVHRYEGTVNQVMGDGIMALFGAPLAHEDHAVRACYAAARMQESVARYGDEVQRTHGAPVQIRIGLNSGEVVVGAIGGDLHMEYTAVGQTVHLASRMEQMARAGSTLLAAETFRLAVGYIHVKPLGPVAVKGLSAPVDAFELIGPSATRTRLQARAGAGLTQFVGRAAELALLRQALAQAAAGHGQVMALVGEPGMGKSRLAWEFTHSPLTRGWLVLEASGVSYGRATPYLPVLDLLRAYVRIDERDDARHVREKLTGKLLTLDPSLGAALPAFFALFEVLGDDREWRQLEAGERARRTREAISHLVVRESQEQPVLLAIEDLHWIDAETQLVLDGLVERLPAARVFLLANYRPEYRHLWTGASYYSQLRLDPLAPETAETLLRVLVGDNPALGPFRALLIERTQGNPFFLEESVRTLMETGVLAGERGACRLVRPLPAVQIPATVQAVVAARIDRLTPEDKLVLETAAVIGSRVPRPVLEAVAEIEPGAVRPALARLQAAEMLCETRVFPEAEYAFTHALTHEVAYASLLQERRRLLHARIFEAIERLYAERLAEQAARLAHHAFRGELWTKALAYLRQAMPSDPQVSVDAVVGGPESPGQLWWAGEHERAVTVGQRDLAIAADFGNFGLRVVSSFRLGQAHHALGDYGRAIEFFGRTVAALSGDLRLEHFGMAGLPAVFARAWLAWCLAEQGRFAEALGHAEEGLGLAEEAGHDFSVMVATWGLGSLHVVRGHPEHAVPVLERGLAIERFAGLSFLSPWVAAPLGAAYALSGRPVDALALLDAAVDRAIAAGLVAGHALRLAWQGDACLLAGQRERAGSLGTRAVQIAQNQKEPGAQGYALLLVGDVAMHREAPALDEAEAAYNQALAIAGRLGMRPLGARSRLALGELLLRSGRRGPARDHLDAARSMLAEMDMRHWLERAERLRPD
jgi:class 3 adenylate cyclase/tetratricopeptide (TPR) repeat protein